MLTDLYNEGMWWAIIKKNTDKRQIQALYVALKSM
jgi:hypothetical protein